MAAEDQRSEFGGEGSGWGTDPQGGESVRDGEDEEEVAEEEDEGAGFVEVGIAAFVFGGGE